jgi:hypothetical protein
MPSITNEDLKYIFLVTFLAVLSGGALKFLVLRFLGVE